MLRLRGQPQPSATEGLVRHAGPTKPKNAKLPADEYDKPRPEKIEIDKEK